MTFGHTPGMNVSKVTISIDEVLLRRIDRMVELRAYASRSQAIQEALREKIERIDRSRLAQECAKLDPAEEQAFAEEGFAGDAAQWPEY